MECLMSTKKNKGKGKGKEQEASVTEQLEAPVNTEVVEGEVTPESEGNVESEKAPLVRAHVPRAPLPERLVDKANRTVALVQDVAKVVADRGAPEEVIDASKVLLDQVTNWARSILDLKDSGWVPTDPSVKLPINEGDPIKIVDDEKGIYSFIPGVLEGTAQLVAGPSIQDGKNQVKILVKDPSNGGVYGYVPKRYLDHRR
jgi:hypothetical protein